MRTLTSNVVAGVSLLGLVPLALFASSYRYVDVYLQSQASKSIEVNANSAQYTSETIVDGQTLQRSIQVHYLGTKEVPTWNGLAPVDGAAMWEFRFEMSAEPDVYAEGCQILVLDQQGKQYRMRAATHAADNAMAINPEPCVPADAPGPTLDFFSNTLAQSPIPRPQTWEATLGVVLPRDVQPDRVQLVWDTPYYAEFPAR